MQPIPVRVERPDPARHAPVRTDLQHALGQRRRAHHIRSLEAFFGFAALLTLVVLALILAGDDASAGAPEYAVYGPDLETQDALPGYMNRATTKVHDLDQDGTLEFIVLSTDGVMQRYAHDGTFAWSTDYRTVGDALGLRLDTAGQWMAEYPWLRPFATTQSGHAFHDIDGDGVDDILGTMFLEVVEPEMHVRSATVWTSGADGSLLDARLHPGLVRHVQLEDFDDDGEPELLIAEEDGTTHGTFPKGSGGRTHLWLEELDGTVVWSHDTGRDWGLIHGFAVGDFDGDLTPDLVYTLTEGHGILQSPDAFTTHIAQDLIARDGTTGTTIWSVPLIDLARAIVVDDVDADEVDDVVLRIREPAAVDTSRGDGRAHVEARRGLDGATLWSLQGLLGSLPEVHDLALADGPLHEVALAYTETDTTTAVAEQKVHVATVNALTGEITHRMSLVETVPTPPSLLPADATVPAPAAVSTNPDIHFLHIQSADADADGDDDLFVGSPRGTVAVERTSSGLVPLWETTERPDSTLFFVVETPERPEVWTQGWVSHDSLDLARGRLPDTEFHKVGRLWGFDGRDGAPLDEHIHMTQMHALVHHDVDGDGFLDRVMGGMNGAVTATKGTSQDILWTADYGNFVLDLEPEDLNGDGTTDFLVKSLREIGAVDGTGHLLWRHAVPAAQGAGELREWTHADLDQDGVRDVVYSYRSGENGGYTAQELSHVTAVSGSDGRTLWQHLLHLPMSAANSLAAGDVTGDGVPDVAATMSNPFGFYYDVAVLDGTTGMEVWRVVERVGSSQTPTYADGADFADADDDGDLDLVVLTNGVPMTLRTHEGATGTTLKTVDVWDGFHVERTRGPLGPDGSDAYALLMTNAASTGIGGQTLAVYTLSSELLYQIHLDVTFAQTVTVAHVDGDAVGDPVVGGETGLVVINGRSALDGAPQFHGNTRSAHATRVAVADLDDDGLDELDLYVYAGNWPVQVGHRFGADVGLGKAVAVVDLGFDDGGGGPPPVNVAPLAAIHVPPVAIFPNEPVTLTSTSSDPDGTIVHERWTLDDGTELQGPSITLSWPTPGTHIVSLTVTDDDGATDTTAVTLGVKSGADHWVTQDRRGSWAAPGETVAWQVTVENTGASEDTYTLRMAAPSEWDAAPGEASVTLPPGGRHTWQVRTDITTPRMSGEVQAVVHGHATGLERSVSHRILVPILIDMEMVDGPVYGALDTIEVRVHLRWLDGTPAAGTWARVEIDGPAPSDTFVQTDDSGMASHTVRRDLVVAHSVGSYSVKVTPQIPTYTTFGTAHFAVEPLG